jgi:hypothetical protein
MNNRIRKLEGEVDLYKKVLAKQERDYKRERETREKSAEIIENENVNLLAEIRTLKEERE